MSYSKPKLLLHLGAARGSLPGQEPMSTVPMIHRAVLVVATCLSDGCYWKRAGYLRDRCVPTEVYDLLGYIREPTNALGVGGAGRGQHCRVGG